MLPQFVISDLILTHSNSPRHHAISLTLELLLTQIYSQGKGKLLGISLPPFAANCIRQPILQDYSKLVRQNGPTLSDRPHLLAWHVLFAYILKIGRHREKE